MINVGITRSIDKWPNWKGRGFTLIELLVVVAIIAVLLAVIAPCLRKAKSITRKMVCQSNLKQLFLGWDSYLSASGGKFFKAKNANLKYGGWKGEQELLPLPLNSHLGLPPEINSPQGAEVYLCPADKGGVPGPDFYEKAFIHFGTSYQTNPLLIGYKDIEVLDNQYQKLHEDINKIIGNLKGTEIDNPSRVILMGDYCWMNRWREGDRPVVDWHDKEFPDNVVFFDGHVDLIQVKKEIYIDGTYTVLPRKSLYAEAYRVQGTEPVDE